MTRLLTALLCILAGAWLIKTSIERKPRKYIILSGIDQGRTWARRLES